MKNTDAQPASPLQGLVSPRSRADSIIKDILDNHLPRVVEGLKAGYVDENQILVIYDHAVRARVMKEHEHQVTELVKVLEEVAEHDTGEQPCIGSDAKEALRKWDSNTSPVIGTGFYRNSKPGTFSRSEWLDLLMACQDGRATCMRVMEIIEREMDMLRNPPKHVYWGAGEPDCPKDIKAPNGELHTLKCKVCGVENPRGDCRATLANAPHEPSGAKTSD